MWNRSCSYKPIYSTVHTAIPLAICATTIHQWTHLCGRALRSSPGPCRRRIPPPPTTPGGLCRSRIQWSNVLKYYFKLVSKCIHILRLVRREEAVEKCLFVHEQLSFLSSSKTSVKDGVGVCDRPGQRAETSISARTSEPTIYSLHRTHQHWQQH